MKNLWILVCVIALLSLSSCDFFNYLQEDGNVYDDPQGNFWANDFRTNKSYRLRAELLAEGMHCNVWVEKGSASSAQARHVAYEYDNKIYQMMIDNFSIKDFSITEKMWGEKKTFADIMQFADWLADGDGKLNILLLDIRDNYRKGVNESFLAGYFWSGDFTNDINSNRKAMIYIDTKPGMDKIEEAFKTLAHEMQHLMNFSTSLIIRFTEAENKINFHWMDTWVDEGLASAAEYLYSGHSIDKINWFINNGREGNSSVKGLIDRGNNFFVWGNREGTGVNQSQYALLDDYSTVYLFFQWLRVQAGHISIYRDIIASPYSDHRAVTTVMNSAVSGHGFSSWVVLLRTWHAANFINASSGIYGYRGDPELSKIIVPAPPSINTSISLAPGEGVYSSFTANSSMPLPSQNNIRYASLSKTGTEFSETLAASGRTLLTYNANLSRSGNSENGATTGNPIASVNMDSPARSVMPETLGPYRIDAGDFISRRQFIPIYPERLLARNRDNHE